MLSEENQTRLNWVWGEEKPEGRRGRVWTWAGSQVGTQSPRLQSPPPAGVPGADEVSRVWSRWAWSSGNQVPKPQNPSLFFRYT